MSKIEWTGRTWNPIVGCSRISEGCRHCYAERMARRLAAMGQTKYQGAVDEHGRWNGVIWFDAPSYDIPLRVKKPTTWFVNSMSDLFHERVGLNWQMRVWEVMRQTPQHTYQILTKRAGEMARKAALLADIYGVLPNVWLGVSVENQTAADERIPHLLRTPAAIRFLSCEPLLGPVELWNTDEGVLRGVAVIESGGTTKGTPDFPAEGYDDSYSGIDWVICGGESGPGARPMHPDWPRLLRDQCAEAGIPFFFKQWGEWYPDKKGLYRAPSQIFGDTVVHRVGKKRAGRLLDGREWNEMPEVANG